MAPSTRSVINGDALFHYERKLNTEVGFAELLDSTLACLFSITCVSLVHVCLS